MSRATSTPRTCTSSVFAPVTIPDLPRRARSAITGKEVTPTAPSEPRCGAERRDDLVGGGGTDCDRAGGVDELLLLQRVVTAQQDKGEHTVEHVDQRLDLPVGWRVVTGREVLDRPHARRVEPRWRVQREGRVRRGIDRR